MKHEDFWKLSKAEQRVAVAKDVIKQLHAERYIPAHKYCDSADPAAESIGIRDKCFVCAIGAAFLSTVKIGNQFDLHGKSDSGTVLLRDISSQLAKVFTKRQVRLIEAAYEKWVFGYGHSSFIAAQFGFQFESDFDRLLAIFQNIIDHNGTFRPEVEYEVV